MLSTAARPFLCRSVLISFAAEATLLPYFILNNAQEKEGVQESIQLEPRSDTWKSLGNSDNFRPSLSFRITRKLVAGAAEKILCDLGNFIVRLHTGAQVCIIFLWSAPKVASAVASKLSAAHKRAIVLVPLLPQYLLIWILRMMRDFWPWSDPSK